MKNSISSNWQLVPKNPDDPDIDGLAMLASGKSALFRCSDDPELEDARACYLAMLAAAPEPDNGQQLVSLKLVADWLGLVAPTLRDAFTKEFSSAKQQG